jgi:general stress protein YciG
MQSNPIDEAKNEKPAPDELLPDAPPKLVDAPTPRKRGFGAMTPELMKAISRKGGLAAHAAGTAHEFTTAEARAAGRKGGQASHAKRRERAEKALAK